MPLSTRSYGEAADEELAERFLAFGVDELFVSWKRKVSANIAISAN